MAATLRYGADSSVQLHFPDGVLLSRCGAPTTPPLADVPAATAEALAEPLEYPPLARSTTPGDRVVLTLAQGTPAAGQIVATVIRSLIEAGVHADGLTVLRSEADATGGLGDPRPWLSQEVTERISLLTHDPSRRPELAYLAATRAGEPILLHRAIVDADVVLPVGCLRSLRAPGYYGIHTPVFPAFSDQQTLRRFRSPTSLDGRGRSKGRPGEIADEVGWLLGVTLTVQVVPGPGGTILHVLAGHVDAVRRQARRVYDAAWRSSVPRRASLVVAAIEGGADQQTWQNVGRALAAAATVVEDGGAIALCCELEARPGPAVQRLADAPARTEAMQWIRRQRPEDALSATLLAQALDRGTVYLLSRLDPSLVEELEIAPITRADELGRLARRHASCILLANAPHAMATLEKDD